MRMRVPKGKPVHENLSTSYVKVGALLADLQVREFTGYVHIGLRGYDAYVFLDAGAIIGAIEQTETASRSGSEAIDGLLLRSEQRDGTVSIYEHAASTIQALSGIIDGSPVYQGLSSDFTDLDKLLRKLSREAASTYYVEVVATEDLGVGVIHVQGDQVDGVYSPLDSPTLGGAAALKTMLEVSEAFGATFNVYSVGGDVTVAAVAEPAEEPRRLSVVPAAEPVAAPAPPPAAAPAPAPRDEEHDITPLVVLMSDVVATIESAVAARDGAGGFAIELRAGQLDVADRYPFLDPFAAEFEYHAGEIAFVGDVDPVDFAAGLGEALHVAVAGLSRRDGADGERVRQRVGDALAGLYDRRQAEFDAFGLAGLLAYISEADAEPSDAATAGAGEAV
jgi:hypothetical protein